jgi:predicted small lipoprotein YifL
MDQQGFTVSVASQVSPACLHGRSTLASLLILVVASLALTACGQKGPLTLTAKPAAAGQAQAKPAATSTARPAATAASAP